MLAQPAELVALFVDGFMLRLEFLAGRSKSPFQLLNGAVEAIQPLLDICGLSGFRLNHLFWLGDLLKKILRCLKSEK